MVHLPNRVPWAARVLHSTHCGIAHFLCIEIPLQIIASCINVGMEHRHDSLALQPGASQLESLNQYSAFFGYATQSRYIHS